MTVVVVGDVGGNPDRLIRALRSIGCDPSSGFVPEGLEVVQVGDLVRLRGNFTEWSTEVVDVVGRFMDASHGRWHQLWGNHDLAVIGGERMAAWDGDVEPTVVESFLRWWNEGRVLFAVAVGNTLISHAGVTRQSMIELGGLDGTAQEVARCIARHNEGEPPGPFGVAGLLVHELPKPTVGCVWAEVVRELCEPWIASGDLPFDQVHGHASVFDWKSKSFWPTVSPDLLQRTALDHDRRISTVNVSNSRITSVDTGLVDAAERPLRLLTLPGSVLAQ